MHIPVSYFHVSCTLQWIFSSRRRSQSRSSLRYGGGEVESMRSRRGLRSAGGVLLDFEPGSSSALKTYWLIKCTDANTVFRRWRHTETVTEEDRLAKASLSRRVLLDPLQARNTVFKQTTNGTTSSAHKPSGRGVSIVGGRAEAPSSTQRTGWLTHLVANLRFCSLNTQVSKYRSSELEIKIFDPMLLVGTGVELQQ